jgi:hypothetical protein
MHQITAYGGLRGKVPFQQAIVQSPGFQPTPSAIAQEAIFQKFLETAKVSTVQEARGLTSAQLQLVNYKIVGESSPYGTFTFSQERMIVQPGPNKLIFELQIPLLTDNSCRPYRANSSFRVVSTRASG